MMGLWAAGWRKTTATTLLALAACSQPEPAGETAGSAIVGDSEVATFAGGCFWCMESPFDKLDGVIATTSGYAGGTKVDPTYVDVTTGGTGHAEAIQVTYDPSKVTYEQLLDVFWHNIDPLDEGGQFCDRGDQYRTAIFVNDEEQRQLAERSRQMLRKGQRFEQPIVTEITLADIFYPAEEYHQDYAKKNPLRYSLLPSRLRPGRAAG